MKRLLFFLSLLSSLPGSAQFTDRYWAFGDSAGIDFRIPTSPVAAESILRSRGTCASICDSIGNLLFYTGTPNTQLWPQTTVNKLGYVVNRYHQHMDNGDTLIGNQWYQEMIIVPNPGNEKQFYVFSCGITSNVNPGMYWSLVDLTYNGGLGRVIQKNVQLQSFVVNDGLAAVKHGNGRDWWLLHKRYVNGGSSDEYYAYLVNMTGVIPMPVQSIGRASETNIFRLKFSPNGNKLVATDAGQYLELFDFDRCTGILSNPRFVHQRQVTTLNGLFWSSEFSPDETKLYLTTIPYGNNDSISCLIQFDLEAPDIEASMDTLQVFPQPFVCGFVKLAPDSQIYLTHMTAENDCDFFYLYCDTTYYPEIMNLSVIHQPNELGALCDFRPYSFYLGGHRSYHGLPNNPNYELGPLAGSVCDTLITSVSQVPVFEPAQLKLFFHTGWRQLFVNGQQLKGKQGSLSLYSVTGQLLRREEISIQPPYYTRQWDLTGTAPGVYIVVLETEKERVSGRVVIE
ncbi:MAG: T9SS type A sorting domain-containing protein [Bacteroidota bacterium]